MIRSRISIALAAALLVGGCNAVEGEFAPGCIAFAGSTITLTDGRFVWDRFTDQIEVDADGNRVDPFPGYPVEGSVTVDGNKVVMIGDDGQAMEPMYLVESGDEIRLLTAQQHASWESGGDVDECALVQKTDD